MALQDLLKKLEAKLRGVAEATLEEDRHPLTIRHRILEAVEDRVAEAERPDAFAARRLEVYLYAPREPMRQLLEEDFVRDDHLAEAIRARLREVGVTDPDRLEIALHLVAEPEPGLAGIEEAGFSLVWTEPETPRRLSEAAAEPAGCRLTVEQGEAEQDAYTFPSQQVVYIGRLREVVDAEGHITRRNDVAFRDEEGAVNATVSRAHAHLRYEPESGSYRLYDEDSACGTSLYRPDESGLIPVRRRGALLQDGDLLYFGKAAVRFRVQSSTFKAEERYLEP